MPHLSPIPWILIPIVMWLFLYTLMITIWFSPKLQLPLPQSYKTQPMNWNWS